VTQKMLNLSKFASNVLSSIDNAAKESREEPKQLSAAQIRSERRQKSRQEPADGESDQQPTATNVQVFQFFLIVMPLTPESTHELLCTKVLLSTTIGWRWPRSEFY
jgi:hypothetical protein